MRADREAIGDPLHIALSKILYPGATAHPAGDTSMMLAEVEALRERNDVAAVVAWLRRVDEITSRLLGGDKRESALSIIEIIIRAIEAGEHAMARR